MGDKYVKNVADSYGRVQQSEDGVSPATRAAFDRITQQPAPHFPPLVDPVVNAAIQVRNETLKDRPSQDPPKAKGFVDDVTGGVMGTLGTALAGAYAGKKFGPWGAAAGAVAAPFVKAVWDHRDELMPQFPPRDNDEPQTPMPPHNTEMPGTEMKPRNYPEYSKY